jgi:hypothetical protein
MKLSTILAATAIAASLTAPALAWHPCGQTGAYCPDTEAERQEVTGAKDFPTTPWHYGYDHDQSPATTPVTVAPPQVGVPFTVPADPGQWFCRRHGRDSHICSRDLDGMNVLCTDPYPGLPQRCQITGYVRNGVLSATPYPRRN